MRTVTAILIFIIASFPDGLFAAPLSSAEQSYYEQSFNYAMDNVAPGKRHDWAGYDSKGSITAFKRFTSKSDYECREFSEEFTVRGEHGDAKGFACKRKGDDGWCKLKAGNALTCAMESPANVIDEQTRAAGEFSGRAGASWDSVWYSFKQWVRSW